MRIGHAPLVSAPCPPARAIERLDVFMARANAAYYATRDPFADFVTAPEIAQVFGELLGAWVVVTWQQMGSPALFLLVEAGPGGGTLMQDARRTIASVAPDCARALRLHLIETSSRLRHIQAARLPDAIWHESREDLPAGPLILLANEFLDALPIRQFIRHPAGWAERHVAGGAAVDLPTDQVPLLDAEPGGVVEQGDAARAWCAGLADRIARDGGAALVLDYGPMRSASGDSLQALRDGRPADPFADAGVADLTAHVDFEAIAAAARRSGAATHGPLPQGRLLTALGLYPRSRRLAQGLPPKAALAIMDAAGRLAQPERMGLLFKALAICHPALPTPAGFE